ncbi:unnamed protein product [Schistosoma margrebowiei]|uniref:Uncharacterized protein n=1 Tax=Schistosoma margrebowiei TaxID=48269 RepID=A0A183MTD5_9TREM|nr:unnamed protein product [Schistosoma margrebowiei]
MSRNCIGNLSPIQRKLLTKRRCQSTFKPLSGLNKNIRKRTYLKRLNDNNSLKPHQIECERLKEILPTVANCENLDEFVVLHVREFSFNSSDRIDSFTNDYLHCLHRCNLHSSSLSSSSLLPAFIFKLLSSQNNQSQSISELFHANSSYHNGPQLNNNYITDDNFLSKSYEYLNSNGSTPYQTDDDIDQLGDETVGNSMLKSANNQLKFGKAGKQPSFFCESHGSNIEARNLMKTHNQFKENYFPQVVISSVPDIMVAIYFTHHLKH